MLCLCEPEHDTLTGPVQRDIVLPHNLVAGKVRQLRPIDNGGYNIRDQITEANQLVHISFRIMRDHRLRELINLKGGTYD